MTRSLPPPPEYVIVDENDRRLWQRAEAGFDARRALAAYESLEQRFPAMKMFLFEARAGVRRMLRNPNLRSVQLRTGALHHADGRAEVSETPVEPASPSDAGELVLVELWHRRPLIRHLNYPGLGFSTEVPERVPRADYDFVTEFLAPAHRPRDTVFRMSQNRGYIWLPGQDRRSTSVGDVLVIHGGGEPTFWMLLSMGFEPFERFD